MLTTGHLSKISHRPGIAEFQSDGHHTVSRALQKPKIRFRRVLNAQFPSSLLMGDYVRHSMHLLNPLGFCKANSLACVSVCRDELTKPLVTTIQRTWDNVFSFSGLAGMLFMGRTGFRAAHHHAPNIGGHRRQVFFAFPHIGIGPKGEIGFCVRREEDIHSPACGALIALQQDMAEGNPFPFDPMDPEQSLIRQRISCLENTTPVPDLVTLTKTIHRLIIHDLERMIATNIDPLHTHYAVFTGIQIHGPSHKCYIWPGTSYAVIHGERRNLSFTPIEHLIPSVGSRSIV